MKEATGNHVVKEKKTFLGNNKYQEPTTFYLIIAAANFCSKFVDPSLLRM